MTNRIARFALPVLALAALLPIAAGAARIAAEGTIKGKVLNEDGTPAAKIEVRVMKPMQGRRGGGGAGGPPPAAPNAVQPAPGAGGGGGGGGRQRPEPVATATTDDKGEFTVTVPVGEYRVMSGKRGETQGNAQAKVEEGKTVEVTINLKKAEPRQPRANSAHK